MKAKTALLSACLTLLILNTSLSAYAGGMNFYDQCLLVPYVFYQTDDRFTAIGISVRNGGTVYWQFTDGVAAVDTSGTFSASANTLNSFIWSQESVGDAYDGLNGSLLFCLDHDDNEWINSDDGDSLAGNAFLVDLGANDVAFLPTVNIDDDDLRERNVGHFNDGENLVRRLPSNAFTDDFLDLQYLIDGIEIAGDDTQIVIWTSDPADNVSQTMTAFNRSQSSLRITVDLPNPNLNVIDPETIAGMAGVFTGDGFIRWEIPENNKGETLYVFAFSIVSSPNFNATQTVLGNY